MPYKWDYKKANEVPLVSILAHFDITLNEGKNGELRGDCPLPNHGKAKGSFVVNLESNSWKCYSKECKSARKDEDKFKLRPVDFVSAAEGITPLEACKHIYNWFKIAKGTASEQETPEVEVVEAPPPVAKPNPEVVNIKAERFMDSLDKDLEETYRKILSLLESETAGITPQQRLEVVILKLKKDTKKRVLESYRNGKAVA